MLRDEGNVVGIVGAEGGKVDGRQFGSCWERRILQSVAGRRVYSARRGDTYTRPLQRHFYLLG